MQKSFVFRYKTVTANSLEEAKEFLKKTYPNTSDEELLEGEETDYDKVFTYFPTSEIIEADLSFIYEYKRKGQPDEIASLPLSRASKYKKIIDKENSNPMPSISHWYH